MNTVDEQYHNLVRKILMYGVEKETRSGKTLSLFGESMRFHLKQGLPILTTKQVFLKGIVVELLWFLKGDTNIKYLLEHNVHIWDDDAYRWYKELVGPNNGVEVWDKATFLENVLLETQLELKNKVGGSIKYTCGDLGDIYGKSWRRFGNNKVDQIQNVINQLKKNPNDRRMLCMAFNPDVLEDVALPPCHIFFQFYTRPMSRTERLDWAVNNFGEVNGEHKYYTEQQLDSLRVPKHALSCLFYCRSQDVFLGTPFNITSYAILTHMIARCANMDVDELIWQGGDVHLYENHKNAAYELLSRNPNEYPLPELFLNTEVKHIDDFTLDTIHIINYQSYPPIKAPLSVGLT